MLLSMPEILFPTVHTSVHANTIHKIKRVNKLYLKLIYAQISAPKSRHYHTRLHMAAITAPSTESLTCIDRSLGTKYLKRVTVVVQKMLSNDFIAVNKLSGICVQHQGPSALLSRMSKGQSPRPRNIF